MEIPYYQIDAFTSRVFSGNPAGVCFLDGWLDDRTLQSIAAENGLPETAFLVAATHDYELRWFTPKVEIDLCGHGTLASAHAVFQYSAVAASVWTSRPRAECCPSPGRASFWSWISHRDGPFHAKNLTVSMKFSGFLRS